MKKKKTLAVSLATMMTLGTLAGATGCKIMETDSARDMEQIIAKVDITQSEDFQKGGTYEAYAKYIPALTIKKRELVAYFLNAGYSYISQGYTYTDTFETLLDEMVDYNIIVEYAMAYFFESDPTAYPVSEYEQAIQDKTGTELTYETLKFFLTHGEDDYKAEVEAACGKTGITRYDMAVYLMDKSVNSAIDSREDTYLTSSSHLHNDSATVQTTPTGIDTEQEYFYQSPTEYTVYTGWNVIPEGSAYEAKDGSTKDSRKKAYNAYLSMLSTNNILKEKETVNSIITNGIASTEYYKAEMITQMEGLLSTKLNDTFEKEAEEKLTENEIMNRLNKVRADEQQAYDKDVSAFESAMDAISDSSFVLYSPQGKTADDNTQYGYVYNILLPFSKTQENALKQAQSAPNAKVDGEYTSGYYQTRKNLLAAIQGTDQRGGWIVGENDYSYISADHYGSASDYLFFEDSLNGNKRYEQLLKYYGKYAYNGTVEYDAAQKEYKVTPNKLSIDAFITEMENYLNYALNGSGYTAQGKQISGMKLHAGDTGHGVTTGANGLATSYDSGLYKLNSKGKKEIDYADFVYYVGQVMNGSQALTVNKNAVFVEGEDNQAYTAMSAFNELQFAYSTDPGALNKYFGYSISKYKTQFMKEFEYAAQLAVSLGVGAYTVAPTDYGWHIIYCTYTFDQGDVYGEFNYNKITEKNTFEYYFYEAMKAGTVSEYQKALETKKVNQYNTDKCVTIWENTYSDYTSLDKTNPNTGETSETA